MDKFRVEMELPGCGGIAVSGIQHQGARDYQEDNYGFSEAVSGVPAERFTAVIADGMGGLPSGAFVSDYIVKGMLQADIGAGEIPVPEQLCSAARRISGEIAAGGSRGGSTMAAVVCVPQGVYFCSVGDSRIYLLRNGELTQLTEDQKYLSVLLDRYIDGKTDYEKATSDPDKDALSQYMGSGTLIIPDRNIMPLAPKPGDRILICSDGVYNAMSGEELLQSLTLSAGAAAEDIVGRILAKGYSNQDNFTAVILEFLSGKPEEHIVSAQGEQSESVKEVNIVCEHSSCTENGGSSLFAGNGAYAAADCSGAEKDRGKASNQALECIAEGAVGNYSPERAAGLLEKAASTAREISGGDVGIAAGFAENGVFTFGSVGGCRVYFLRCGKVFARTGSCSEEEATDVIQKRIQPGDTFLVCSEGFAEYISEHEMEADRLKSECSAQWLRYMVKRILIKSGGRSFPAVCGYFTEQPQETAKSPARRFNAKMLIAAGIAVIMLCALAVTLILLAGNTGEAEGSEQPGAAEYLE